jgi:hypothetical protein
MHRTVRALLSAAAAALSATTVLVGLAAGPAQANNYGSLPLTAWAYTDKARPSTPDPNPSGDFRIGGSEGSTGRAYFTYDLTSLKGQVLHRVTFYSIERTVDDCSQVAPIQVWRTKPVTSTTTWQHPPKELELLKEVSYGKGVICPGAYLGVDMIPAIQAAFARGEKTITLEVRIAAGAEAEGKAGRTMRPAAMGYDTNHAPTVSALKLGYPDAGCGTPEKHPTAGTAMHVQATAKDADADDHPYITYAYWPVDRPDLRKVSGPSFDLSGFTDGTVVAWSAQADDYTDLGPWSRTCYFTVDKTAPTTTPVVASRTYPAGNAYPGTGGPGVTGSFVFDAAGDTEITGFDWNSRDGGLGERAIANHPGGRAKVTVTPRRWGPASMEVAAVDAAGNRGPWVEYEYMVRNTAPFAVIEMNGVGLTSHITLRSPAAETTEFGYAIDGGPEIRVPVVDGKGVGDLMFTSVGTKTFVERTYAGKKVIGTGTEQVTVTDAPKVASAEFDFPGRPAVGTRGSFTFTPRAANVVAYRYDFGDGDIRQVDARPDGSAAVDWSPEKGGSYAFTVSSVDVRGDVSQPATKSIFVLDDHPTVSANDWYAHVGEPISVNVWSELPDAVGIVYRFDGGPQQMVTGAYAHFSVVPTHSGDNPVTVWAKRADGTLSPSTTYVIHITSAPAVSSRGPFTDAAVMGRPVSLTFSSAQEGATTFRYTVGSLVDSADHPELTVPVGPDGTATVSYEVPEGQGDVAVTVASLTGAGEVSDTNTTSVPVSNPTFDVTSSPFDGVGVTGQFTFTAYDLSDVTTKFLWRVDDGPVQETAYDPWAWETIASYTSERAGMNTLTVQREFTDGSLSPLQTVAFEVGTQPAEVTRG